LLSRGMPCLGCRCLADPDRAEPGPHRRSQSRAAAGVVLPPKGLSLSGVDQMQFPAIPRYPAITSRNIARYLRRWEKEFKIITAFPRRKRPSGPWRK